MTAEEARKTTFYEAEYKAVKEKIKEFTALGEYETFVDNLSEATRNTLRDEGYRVTAAQVLVVGYYISWRSK